MKKICFITTINITVKAFVYKQANMLAKAGYDITIICAEAESLKNFVDERIHLKSLPFKRGIDFLGVLPNIFRLYSVFKQNKFDLINYLTPNASFYACIAGKLAGIEQRIYSQCGLRFIELTGIKYQVFRFVEKLTCKMSSEIQPVSKSMREYCIGSNFYSERKTKIIYNGSSCGVDFTKFDVSKKEIWRKKLRDEYSLSETCTVIGFVGRVTKDKGILELLEAFRALKLEDTQLWIVGAEEMEKFENSETFQWSKTQKNIFYMGQVDCVEQYLAAMDIFVLPSYREGFGNVSIEAQAMKVPCIVSNILGLKDTVIPNITGYLVETKSVEDIMQKILLLKNNRQNRIDFQERGYQFVKEQFNEVDLMSYFLEDKRSKIGE